MPILPQLAERYPMMASIIRSKPFRIVFATLFWIAVWYLAALAIGSELFLPYPHTTFQAFFRLLGETVFWKSIGNSFVSIITGCLCGIAIGILLASLAAIAELIKAVILPFITILRATPVASIIILIYVIVRKLRLDLSTVSFLIVMFMVIPIVYANLYTAFMSFDKKLTEVAKVYRFPLWKKIKIVYYPQIRPYLFAAISNALGFAWKAGVAAEVICGLAFTIGQNLADAKSNLEMDLLFGWTITVVLLSLLFEFLFKIILKQTTKKGGKRA